MFFLLFGANQLTCQYNDDSWITFLELKQNRPSSATAAITDTYWFKKHQHLFSNFIKLCELSFGRSCCKGLRNTTPQIIYQKTTTSGKLLFFNIRALQYWTRNPSTANISNQKEPIKIYILTMYDSRSTVNGSCTTPMYFKRNIFDYGR